MKLPERLGALAKVAQVLSDLDITYVVGGSVASSRWGIPRMTNDIDLVVDLASDIVGRLARALEEDFYVDEVTAQEAVRQRRSFNLIAREDFTKIDLFVVGSGPWHRAQLARRRLEHLPPDITAQPVYIASAEDTVLAKLLWYEQGNRVSDRQWQDVLAVLRVQGPVLDLAYLRKHAVELGLVELLDLALARAYSSG